MKGWAVGDLGTIIHTTNGGKTWKIQECPVKNELTGVSFADQNNGFAIGKWGIILKYSQDKPIANLTRSR
jgi:photosystem II stability/assembly factor-like uncharacterized protein